LLRELEILVILALSKLALAIEQFVCCRIEIMAVGEVLPVLFALAEG
jgi:hypothetical protein